jgi:amino acid transporter
MEAAACYVGECRNGPRDAKIALTAEGVYGMLIYILTPLVFVGVLGAALSTADPLTLYTDFTSALFGHGTWIKWFIGLPLILALLLSVLNAIMGTGRSLFQASADGTLPRWFGKVNTHGVPARAMAFNVAASMLVVLFGSPVRIYIFSNAGYLFACAMSLLGYFVYRQLRPAAERPFRLPGWVRYVALAIFLFWAVVYFYGGWNAPNIVVAPNSGPVLFILGLVVMALYFPLYYWRKRSDQRRPAPVATTVPATVAAAAPVLAEEES